MIRKLRIKFVLTAMIVIIIVTSSIFGFITYGNYETLNKTSKAILNYIAINDGKIPEYSPHENFNGVITKETKFSTRYFYIITDANNKTTSLNVDNIASVSDKEAEEIVSNILKIGQDSGRYHNYVYKIVHKENNQKMIVVLDYTFQFNNINDATKTALKIVSIGLLLIFSILVIISKRVLSPIIENIEKQKQFISNAGHELKTPIAVIVANSEVMEMTVKSEENLELVKSIKKQAKRLDELTATLLSLAKAEEGRIDNEFEEFSLTEMVKSEIDDFKALAKGKEITYECTNDIKITADKTNIKELIIIFLDNAIKYSNESGKIIVKTEKQGKNNVKMQFMNTCDNPKDIDVNKIFDRFYREDKSRNKKKLGYGIGLSMAKSIVDMHKGKISAEITKDNMICFNVII